MSDPLVTTHYVGDIHPPSSAGNVSSKDKETVKVVVRCRPLFGKELVEGHKPIISMDISTGLVSIKCPENKQSKSFTFDAVYNETTTQRLFYDEAAYPLVESIFEGYNGTIFAYGQTGCGKTHTMQGKDEPPELRGVIPLSFDHIFDTIKADQGTEYMVRASYLEIYNEDIRDLLSDDSKKKLDLKETSDGIVYVKDLTEIVVRDVESLNKVMSRGFKNRTIGATLMNEGSSRSHSIFTVVVETNVKDVGGQDHFRAGKLNLVDLAGSERQSKTGATGNRLKEGCKINLSLSALGNVISALVDGKGKHIPYRDSKLTRLLQDSLGGNTKTLMVAAISPAEYNYDETLSTLRYANRAKNIKNKPIVNEDPKDAKLREYKEEIERLKVLLDQQARNPKLDDSSSSNNLSNSHRLMTPQDFTSSASPNYHPQTNGQIKLLTEERKEIEKRQMEAAEMLVQARQMMEEAKALKAQKQYTVSDLEILSPAHDDGNSDKADSRGIKENLVLSGRSEEQTLNVEHQLAAAAELDSQAKEMMVKAQKMMDDAAQQLKEPQIRIVKEIVEVVKEIVSPHQLAEAEELKKRNESILQQNSHMGKQLELTQETMEYHVREKAELIAKLSKIESQILGGTRMTGKKSNIDADSEVALLKQQVEFRRAQNKLKAKTKKEAQNEAQRKLLLLEKQHIEEELKSAQVNVQTTLSAAKKRETKFKARIEAAKQEVVDLNKEFEHERETLLDTIREQTKETKLLEQLVEMFLPKEELVKVWERAIWINEREEWQLPRLKPRGDLQKLRLPTLSHKVGAAGISNDSSSLIAGGLEVISDDETISASHPATNSASSLRRPKHANSTYNPDLNPKHLMRSNLTPPSRTTSPQSNGARSTFRETIIQTIPISDDSKMVGISPKEPNISNTNRASRVSGSRERRRSRDKLAAIDFGDKNRAHLTSPHDISKHPNIVGECGVELQIGNNEFPLLKQEYQSRDRLQSRLGSRQGSRQSIRSRGIEGNDNTSENGLGGLCCEKSLVYAPNDKFYRTDYERARAVSNEVRNSNRWSESESETKMPNKQVINSKCSESNDSEPKRKYKSSKKSKKDKYKERGNESNYEDNEDNIVP